MPKAANKRLESKINEKSWSDKEVKKQQFQEMVKLMSSSLESADRKIEEIKDLLEKNGRS
jgi:uncharacterized protein YegL